MTARLRVRLSPGALPGNNLGQVVYTHVPLIKQYILVPLKGGDAKGQCLSIDRSSDRLGCWESGAKFSKLLRKIFGRLFFQRKYADF